MIIMIAFIPMIITKNLVFLNKPKTKKMNNSKINESEKIGENNRLKEININNHLKDSIIIKLN